ncbi:MAG: transposase, partial [Desulfobulbaceae bacterium]|nr:transposase [Desulfobulbaceae bacterium]
MCNAHHLRELERAWEQDKQEWAQSMKFLLLKINKAVDQHGDKLPIKVSTSFKDDYRAILKKAEIECPPPDEKDRVKGQRGRLKRSKARNLLERLTKFEIETLRFMDDPLVPFTNNKGENDIRMTKVHQKISG